MKRLNHFIKPTTSTSQPEMIIGIDAEGEKVETLNAAVHECKLTSWGMAVAVKDNNGEFGDYSILKGDSQLGFWQELRSAINGKGVVWVISYNTTYVMSLLGLWERLSDRKWTISDHDSASDDGEVTLTKESFKGFIVADDPPFIAVIRPVGTPGVVKLVDMRNYGVTRRQLLSPNMSIEEECCDFLVSICKLLSTEQLGGLQATGASQAMHCYRRVFMDKPILVHNEWPALALERQCLYSGRNECFRLGVCRGRIFHLDFNSFYPSIAADAWIPCRLQSHGRCSLEKLANLRHRGYCVIADCMITTTAPFYPYRHNGTTIYPTGIFRTQLCGPEIDLALQLNHLASVEYAAWYEPDQIFAQWAAYVHGMRIVCECNERWAEAALYKCMNNSLYGKFAQQKRGWQNRPDIMPLFDYGQWWGKPPLEQGELDDLKSGKDEAFPPPEVQRESYVRWRSIGWTTQVENVPEEAFNSCPVVTSWLYSLARIKLLTAIGIAGFDNVYYCDTDSIWTNEIGLSSLAASSMVDQTELGKLKIVGDFTEVIFHGLKHYETPTRHVHAGVPDHAESIGPRHFEYRSSERLAAALQCGRSPKAISVVKQVAYSPHYRHGRLDGYGKVHPWQIYKGVTPDGRDENCIE